MEKALGDGDKIGFDRARLLEMARPEEASAGQDREVAAAPFDLTRAPKGSAIVGGSLIEGPG